MGAQAAEAAVANGEDKINHPHMYSKWSCKRFDYTAICIYNVRLGQTTVDTTGHKECEFIWIFGDIQIRFVFDFTLWSIMLIAGGTHLELVRMRD